MVNESYTGKILCLLSGKEFKFKQLIDQDDLLHANHVVLDKEQAYNIYKIRLHINVELNRNQLHGLEETVKNIQSVNTNKVIVSCLEFTTSSILTFCDEYLTCLLGVVHPNPKI